MWTATCHMRATFKPSRRFCRFAARKLFLAFYMAAVPVHLLLQARWTARAPLSGAPGSDMMAAGRCGICQTHALSSVIPQLFLNSLHPTTYSCTRAWHRSSSCVPPCAINACPLLLSNPTPTGWPGTRPGPLHLPGWLHLPRLLGLGQEARRGRAAATPRWPFGLHRWQR